jgi:hypothetical protein
LVGGFVGAVIWSAVAILLDWQRARRSRDERERWRAHELEVRTLEQARHLHLATMQDAARVRGAHFARLNDDVEELTRALFDLVAAGAAHAVGTA